MNDADEAAHDWKSQQCKRNTVDIANQFLKVHGLMAPANVRMC